MAVIERKEPIDVIRQLLEAYGVGVRAGVLTPCAEDEIAFRKMMKLPDMPPSVKSDWDDSEGIRRPITLQRPAATEGEDPLAVSVVAVEEAETETEAADHEAEKETEDETSND